MELTKSFPPADDLMTVIQGVDYQKLYDRFLTVTATILAVIVAVSMLIKTATVRWYQNGGKDQLISVANRMGLFDTLSTVLLSVNKLSEKIYYTLQDVEQA